MRSLVGALALICACSSGEPVEPLPHTPSTSDLCELTQRWFPVAGFGVVGEPKQTTVKIGMKCAAGLSLRARVEVRDPQNRPVATAEGNSVAVTAEDDIWLVARLTFTPTMPGAHHVAVTFEPNLGTQQLDVPIGVDHSSQAPVLTLPPSSGLDGCRHVDVAPSGRLLCLSPRVAVFERSGALLQELAAVGLAARSGDVLWVHVHDDTLNRWVETDAGFVRSPDVGQPLSGPAALLPGTNDVVGLSPSAFADRYRVSGNGFAMDRMPLPTTSALSGLRQGDDHTLVISDHAICRVDWTADGGASCSGSPGFLTPVGAEAGRVWALTVSPSPFMPVFALSAVTRDRIDSLMLGAAGSSSVDRPRVTQWDFVPWVFHPTASHVLFPEVRDGFLVFDRLPPGKPVMSITSRWIARGDHTGIDLYAR